MSKLCEVKNRRGPGTAPCVTTPVELQVIRHFVFRWDVEHLVKGTACSVMFVVSVS